MFGQGNTFGNQNTSFGQSAFGANKPTAFGTPSFGAANPGATSLFGATPQQPATNLFGTAGTSTPFGQAQTPAFGTQAASTTGFGGFGATANAPATGTSMFGTGTTGLFGSQPQQPAANTGGLFGAGASTFGNKPAFGGFGSTPGTSMFGQAPAQQPQPAGSLFGQPQPTAATGGLFGVQMQAQTGTGVAKFKPFQTTDTISKNNTTQTVQVRHQVITCMPEYESRSFEELRFEDYQANRKGPAPGGSVFGAQPASGGLFGAPATSQAATGGLFGQQQKTLFGATSAPAPTFGTTTSLFGQAPQQQTTSLFGGGAKPFGAATTTASAFTFGQTTTTPAVGGGLFGNKPFGAAAPQPSTGLFGAPATSTGSVFGAPSTGFGGFGAASQAASPFGQKTAFGAAPAAGPFSFAPAASSAGSLFGTTQAKPLFGQTSQPFGATTTSTPSLFGQAPTATPFGATSQPSFTGFGASTGMFGAKPGTGFGTTTAFGTAPSLFGTAQAAPAAGSAFGTTGMFGSAAPAATTGFFGQAPTMQQAQPVAPQQGSALASQLMAISQSTFSDNPVLRNIVEGPSRREELLRPSIPQVTPSGKNGMPTYYRVSPRLSAGGRPQALSATSSVKVGMFDGLEEDENRPADDLLFKPRQSVKKLTLKPRTGTSRIIFDVSGAQSPAAEMAEKGSTPIGGAEMVQRRSARLDDTTSELIRRPPSTNLNESVANQSMNMSMNTTMNETHREPHEEPEVENIPPHPLGIICRRYGYYTIPSLDELAQMEQDEDGAVIVDNFVVGREGYGNVLFKGPIDIVNADIDKFVHILHKQVNVYPSDDEKPPVGHGFNKKAQVTLDRVWPLDKSAGVEIRDPKRLEEMRYREKLQSCSAKSGAFFKEYRPETGSWVFDVPHFSKYGIDETEEDEERENQEASPVVSDTVQTKKDVEAKTQYQPARVPFSPLKVGTVEDLQQKKVVPSFEVDHMEERQDFQAPGPGFTSGPRQLLAFIGTPVQRTQLNKLTMFDDVDQEMEFGSVPVKKRKGIAPASYGQFSHGSLGPLSASVLDSSEMDLSVDMRKTSFREILDKSISLQYQRPRHDLSQSLRETRPGSAMSRSVVAPEDFDTPANYTKVKPGLSEAERLRKVLPKFGFWCPSGIDSSVNATQKTVADKDLLNEKRGRMGWTSKMSFVLPAVDNRSASMRLGASPFVATVNQVAVENLNPTKPSKPIGHLRLLSSFQTIDKLKADGFSPGVGFYGKMLLAELDGSTLDESQEGYIHRFTPPPGTTLLESQLSAAQSFLAETKELGFVTGDMAYINYTKEVLALCSVLWGKLPSDIKAGSYAESMLRKKLLGDWLKEYASMDSFPSGNSSVDFALADMTGQRHADACGRLMNAKDFVAALMTSQVGTHQTKSFTGSQLEHWTSTHADRFIDRSRFRYYCQLAGISTYKGSNFSVNVCEKLGWRQAFAHHLWYVIAPTGTIADALEEFNEGYSDGYAAKPLPSYLEQSSAERSRDLCYHLVKLFCYKKTPLEPLLNPASSTPDPVEYTLSYFLMQVILALGYSHLTEFAEGTVLTSFASQLEALGHWVWAIFIGLHIRDPLDREAFVKGILCRHVRVENDARAEQEVSFLLERLFVPREWIAAAASYRAQSLGLNHLRARYLVEAKMDDKAHRLIVERLAPDAALGRKTDLVTSLLEVLSEPDRCSRIFDWNDDGEIYLNYFRIVRAADELLDSDFPSAVELEKLLPEVKSLCGRIDHLPTPTVKHKLVRGKIAKRTAEILRAVLKMQNGGQLPPLQLLPRVSQLPFPEDSAMEELQNVLRSYTLENACDENYEGLSE